MAAGENVLDKDVSEILSDMLEIESQIHKENDDVTLENNYVSNDDYVHEYVKVDIVIAHVDVVNNNKKKRRSASKGKKAHAQEDVEEDVNDNLNKIKVYLNKKNNESITRKKVLLAIQDYAQIKGVDFDETSTPIAHLEAIIMFLGLYCSLMFTCYQMDVKSSFLNRHLNMEVNQDASIDIKIISAISSTKFWSQSETMLGIR